MKKVYVLIAVIFIPSLLIAGLVFFGRQTVEDIQPGGLGQAGPRYHSAVPADKEFYSQVYSFDKKAVDLEKRGLFGGVVPHHLLAGDMMAEFYGNCEGLEFDTIVLLGPNHFDAGSGAIIGSGQDWETPFGRLESDREILDMLKNGLDEFSVEPEFLGADHAITSQAGFIKKTFPKAKFAPIIVRHGLKERVIRDLASKIFQYGQQKDILFLVSADFSHYKDSQSAQADDKKSIQALKEADPGSVFDIEVDSRPAIYALLEYNRLQSGHFYLLNNSNSAILAGKTEVQSVTSYITGYYTRENIDPVKLIFFGDMMLDRHVGEKIAANGLDSLLLDFSREVDLNDYDLVSANLEGVVTDAGGHYPPVMAYDFAFHPDLINELHKYNFGYFTIANNHITDQGAQGIREARQNLLSLDFAFSGCQDGVIGGCTATTTVVKGKRIALLGFSKVYSRLDPAKVRQAISQAQEASDLVIVNIHWGQEYKPEFSRPQQELAHIMAESGADIIIGHHPHVIQGIEVYEGVPIFYSLGNFIFDQYFSHETQQGFGVAVVWSDDNFEIDLLPYRSEKSKIRLMNEQEEEAFLRRLLEISDLKENNQVDLMEGGFVLEKIN